MQSIGRKEFKALRQQHPEAFKAMQRVVRWKAIKLLLLDAYHARLASELQARIKGIEATPPGQGSLTKTISALHKSHFRSNLRCPSSRSHQTP